MKKLSMPKTIFVMCYDIIYGRSGVLKLYYVRLKDGGYNEMFLFGCDEGTQLPEFQEKMKKLDKIELSEMTAICVS